MSTTEGGSGGNTLETEELSEEKVPADDKLEYIEFVGVEPYFTEFYKGEHGTHTVNKAQMKSNHDIDLGAKELVWRKDGRGRMLVPVTDMSPEAANYLSTDPMFKRVIL